MSSFLLKGLKQGVSSFATLAARRNALQSAKPLIPACSIATTSSRHEKGSKKEELSGPIKKVMDLFDHMKTQLTEDNVQYEKSKPFQKPTSIKRESVESPMEKIDVDSATTTVTMHKDSAWKSEWKNFTENNAVSSGISEIQQRFDESDNFFVRSARGISDTLQERFGSLLQDDDDSKKVLRELQRLDPTFDRTKFELHLERHVVPAVLEGFFKGDLDSLKGWCAAPCYAQMETLIQQRNQEGLHLQASLLDVSDLEFQMAKQMDDNLVMIFSVQTQQTKVVTNNAGDIVEGGKDYIEHCFYIFAMRRDTNIFDPMKAWQVLEISQQLAREII
eukprot:m.6460 g.6460  ORF g.6460 m.6460 type:complete len:333 (+) comp2600_c0_seq1:52-1050(+)